MLKCEVLYSKFDINYLKKSILTVSESLIKQFYDTQKLNVVLTRNKTLFQFHVSIVKPSTFVLSIL